MTEKTRSVVVVGAGPIGCYLAYLLAKKGLNPLILEEHKVVGRPVHCTGIIGGHAFDEYDLNSNSIRDTINTITMEAPSGERITYGREKPLAYAVCRSTYDQNIAEQAVKAGAELRLGVRVRAVEQEDDGVTLFCNGSEKIRARVCVLATGALSNLPFKMGLGVPKRFMLAAQIEGEVDDLPHTEVFVNQELAPGFFAWAVPINGGGSRIGLCAPEKSQEYMKRFLDWLRDTRNLRDDTKISYSRIPIGICKQTYNKRIVSIGDAASQVKPTTGGGLYYGLKCAQTLASTLNHRVLDQKKWSPHYFRTYEQRWRRQIGSEIKVMYLFKEIAAKTNNHRLDQIIHELNKETLYSKIFQHADFDYHRKMILKMFSNPILSGIFLGSFKDWVLSRVQSAFGQEQPLSPPAG